MIATSFMGCVPAIPPGGGDSNGDGSNDNLDLIGGFVLQDLPGALLSISGMSATDVYAVGADAKDETGPVILHYDGTTWLRLDSGLTAGDLWWITTPPVEGQFFMSGDPGLILRFDPTQGIFEQYTTPGTETMFGVWGASLDDVWAVGGDLDNPETGGVIWHFDGAEWSIWDTSDIAPDGLVTLYKTWGRSASEIYAVGRVGTVLRFDGQAWSVVPTESTRTFFTVHGNDDLVVATGGATSAVIEELDGDTFVERADSTTPQMNGVFVAPDGNAYAVGIAGFITHRNDENRWPAQRTSLDTILDFHGAWIDDEGGLWAVGGDLTVDLNDGIVAYFGSRMIRTQISP